MNDRDKKKIGIIGFGQIGSSLYQMIIEDPDLGLEVAFIHESQPEAAARIPAHLNLPLIADLAQAPVDLVVEAAHPQAVRDYAEPVLSRTDLMIMSVSSLGDQALEERLKKVCRENKTSLFIPHGATLGLDGLRDGLSIWKEVSITMRKNPRNLNFAAAPELKPEDGAGTVVLYDGPCRGVLPLFPKNVNSHATLALATLGLDKTRSILVSDPSLEESVIEIRAQGGGTSIEIERRNPIKGVTGKLTILSVMESIKNIVGRRDEIKIC